MNNRLIFQHIPKTAGSSLAKLFLCQFQRKHVFVCGSQDGVLSDFIALRSNQRNRFKLLIGHLDYGIHEYFHADVKYITFLRDPVDRVLSHYYYIRSYENHRYHNVAQKMDIDEFISNGIRPRMNNCMVRMISGLNPPYGFCDETMLEKALENIRRDYAFVGFFSCLSHSVDLLVHQMNWKSVEIEKRNPTKNRPDKTFLSQTTLDLICRYNALDIKLYHLMASKL